MPGSNGSSARESFLVAVVFLSVTALIVLPLKWLVRRVNQKVGADQRAADAQERIADDLDKLRAIQEATWLKNNPSEQK